MVAGASEALPGSPCPDCPQGTGTSRWTLEPDSEPGTASVPPSPSVDSGPAGGPPSASQAQARRAGRRSKGRGFRVRVTLVAESRRRRGGPGSGAGQGAGILVGFDQLVHWLARSSGAKWLVVICGTRGIPQAPSWEWKEVDHTALRRRRTWGPDPLKRFCLQISD